MRKIATSSRRNLSSRKESVFAKKKDTGKTALERILTVTLTEFNGRLLFIPFALIYIIDYWWASAV